MLYNKHFRHSICKNLNLIKPAAEAPEHTNCARACEGVRVYVHVYVCMCVCMCARVCVSVCGMENQQLGSSERGQHDTPSPQYRRVHAQH